MDALLVAVIALVVAFASAMAGMLLARCAPDHHLDAATKDTIKLAIGLIATLSALVLGMLIHFASGIYQSERNEVQQLAADVLLIDRLLAAYGPEAAEARAGLRRSVAATVGEMWPAHESPLAEPGRQTDTAEGLWGRLIRLEPANDEQRALKSRAVDIAGRVAATRFLIFAQGDSGIPAPFLAVLIAWIALIFTGFGFLAPSNPTVTITLLAAALCVAGAFFLLIELAQPFDGFLKLSGISLRDLLALLGR